jgi:signal transduction histidine kinase
VSIPSGWWSRVAPFVVAYVLAFATYPLGDDRYGLPFVLAAIAAVAVVLIPWHRLPLALEALPLLLYLASVAALRDAHGGARSGYAPMVMLAAVWAGVFGRLRTIALVIAGIAVELALPPFVADAPSYPASEFRRALLTTLTAALVAVVAASLVRAREGAERHLAQLRATEIHDDIVQSIAAAQLGLAVNDRETVDRALAEALRCAQKLAADLFVSGGRRTVAGSLRRTWPNG